VSLDPNDPTVRAAVFGEQVKLFLDSDIGTYLVGQAKHQVEANIDKLKSVAWWRKRRIQQLQNDIRTAENFATWLGDAYFAGLQATKYLEGKDDG
jgi:hypothetical protein